MKNFILVLLVIISFSSHAQNWADDSKLEEVLNSSSAFGDDESPIIVLEYWAKFNEANAFSDWDKVTNVQYGEPLWCRGTGMRNTHLLAVAPTVSNSVICGGISAGIEPLPANVYTFNGAKGTFIRKNKVLEALLESKGENKQKWWKQMLEDGGSVLGLPDNILSSDEKEIFLTFSETNQLELVEQAAERQKYIDQTQSLNLSFDPNDSPKWINQVHMEGWKLGVKTFYYLRTDSVIKGDLGSRQADCVSCDG